MKNKNKAYYMGFKFGVEAYVSKKRTLQEIVRLLPKSTPDEYVLGTKEAVELLEGKNG